MAQQDKNSGVHAAAGDENGVPLLRSGAAAYLKLDARAATLTKTGTPSIFSGTRAATQIIIDDAAHLYYHDSHTAVQTKNGAPYISSDGDGEPAAAYCNSGEAFPLASQVSGDKTASVLGISVASLAIAGLAAGEPTPAVGFGLFLMLIAGLSTVTIRVLRA